MPRGGAISQTERVRLAEDAVLKTVAPAMVSKVRVLGAPPFHPPAEEEGNREAGGWASGAIAARLVLNQERAARKRPPINAER